MVLLTWLSPLGAAAASGWGLSPGLGLYGVCTEFSDFVGWSVKEEEEGEETRQSQMERKEIIISSLRKNNGL